MSNERVLIIFISLTLALYYVQGITFCSSYCSHSVTACNGITKADCTSCASSIFFSAPNSSNPSNPCTLLNQYSYIADELSITGMNLSQFITSNNVVQTCSSIYLFSGKYVDYDYISKNFTQLSSNHYGIVIRFSVGYAGTWSATQYLNLYIQHQYGSFNNLWTYSCSSTSFLCINSGIDCYQTKEFVINHNNSFLFLNFSALYNQSNPLIQFWGIKDLIIISKNCHSTCLTCVGPLVTDCTSCSFGSYLNGNTCVATCPVLYVPSLNLCTITCPIQYFKNSLSNNCQPCMNGCLYCSNTIQCIIWKDQNANPQKIWQKYIEIWIILIVLGFLLTGIGIWKLIIHLRLRQPVEPSKKKIPALQISHQFTNGNLQEDIGSNVRQQLQGLKPPKRRQFFSNSQRKMNSSTRSVNSAVQSFGKK